MRFARARFVPHPSSPQVINFLDARVQELEAQCKALRGSVVKADETLLAERSGAHEQVQMLKDTLAHEKQMGAESEAEFKNQRRLLVREVRMLRAQLARLQGFNSG